MNIYQFIRRDRTNTKSTLVSPFMNKIFKLDFLTGILIIENSDFKIWYEVWNIRMAIQFSLSWWKGSQVIILSVKDLWLRLHLIFPKLMGTNPLRIICSATSSRIHERGNLKIIDFTRIQIITNQPVRFHPSEGLDGCCPQVGIDRSSVQTHRSLLLRASFMLTS